MIHRYNKLISINLGRLRCRGFQRQGTLPHQESVFKEHIKGRL